AMVRAYRGAEVVVCPSRFEGFGLTPMEAIACGRPVVASDIPPHREFLGTAPRFFAVGDDDGLAAAIAAARSDPAPAPAVVRALRGYTPASPGAGHSAGRSSPATVARYPSSTISRRWSKSKAEMCSTRGWI